MGRTNRRRGRHGSTESGCANRTRQQKRADGGKRTQPPRASTHTHPHNTHAPLLRCAHASCSAAAEPLTRHGRIKTVYPGRALAACGSLCPIRTGQSASSAVHHRVSLLAVAAVSGRWGGAGPRPGIGGSSALSATSPPIPEPIRAIPPRVTGLEWRVPLLLLSPPPRSPSQACSGGCSNDIQELIPRGAKKGRGGTGRRAVQWGQRKQVSTPPKMPSASHGVPVSNPVPRNPLCLGARDSRGR